MCQTCDKTGSQNIPSKNTIAQWRKCHHEKIRKDKITTTFPSYPLQVEVVQDLIQAFKGTKKRILKQLPKLPKFVGGDTDFMIGIRYLRYYPQKIFDLPTGLTIYESKFRNIDGTRGIVGGPHHVFTEIEKCFYGSVQQQKTYLSQQYSLFKM